MIIPALIPTKMSSLRPSKRKIVRTAYVTEKFTKSIQKDLPEETRGIARFISEHCRNFRISLTKN